MSEELVNSIYHKIKDAFPNYIISMGNRLSANTPCDYIELNCVEIKDDKSFIRWIIDIDEVITLWYFETNMIPKDIDKNDIPGTMKYIWHCSLEELKTPGFDILAAVLSKINNVKGTL